MHSGGGSERGARPCDEVLFRRFVRRFRAAAVPPPARWCRGRRSGTAVLQAVQHARAARRGTVAQGRAGHPQAVHVGALLDRVLAPAPRGSSRPDRDGLGSVRLPPDRAARGLRHMDEGDVAADHLDRGHVAHAVGRLECCRLLQVPDESFTQRRRRGVPAADSVQAGPWSAQHLQRLPGVVGDSDPSVDLAVQAERTAAPEEPDGMGQKPTPTRWNRSSRSRSACPWAPVRRGGWSPPTAGPGPAARATSSRQAGTPRRRRCPATRRRSPRRGR
jgi:hypothetical protein